MSIPDCSIPSSCIYTREDAAIKIGFFCHLLAYYDWLVSLPFIKNINGFFPSLIYLSYKNVFYSLSRVKMIQKLSRTRFNLWLFHYYIYQSHLILFSEIT